MPRRGRNVAELKLLGGEIFIKEIHQLPERSRRKVFRQAVNKAIQLWVKDIRGRLPRRTGLLRKAFKKKVVTNKLRGFITGIVGVDRNVFSTKSDLPPSKQRVRPLTYAHLVEFGVYGGKGGRGLRAVQRSFSSQLFRVRTLLVSESKRRIAIEAAKIASKVNARTRLVK